MWNTGFEEDKENKSQGQGNETKGEDLDDEMYKEKTFNLRLRFVNEDNMGLEVVKTQTPVRRNSSLPIQNEEEGQEMPNFNTTVMITLNQAPITLPDIILCASENEGIKELTILKCAFLPEFDVELFKQVMYCCKTKGSFWEFVKGTSGMQTLKIFLIGVIFRVRKHFLVIKE